jgi:signal transduction histidine kinase
MFIRSLTVKLVLAFLLTSVVGIALAAIFIRQLVVFEFDEYVITQRRTEFMTTISEYYVANGTWAGIDRWLRGPGAKPGYGNGQAGNRPPARIFFEVADTKGVIQLSPEPRRIGQVANPYELSRGKAIDIDGAVVGTLLTPDRTSFRDGPERSYLLRTDWALGAAALVAGLVALVIGVLLARFITRPVRELTVAARAIAAGDLHQQVPVRSSDDLGVLATQFNSMSSDLARANQLRRQMTADIAHDLRTPLTVIAGYLESLRDGMIGATPRRFAAMYDETRVLMRLVDDLHMLSMADAGALKLDYQVVDPRRLLERAAVTHQVAAEQHGVTLQVEVAQETPQLMVDTEQLSRVLNNLIANALNHTPEGGRITLAARPVAEGVELAVADTGSGIAEEHLQNIFERFYRADPSRQTQTGGSGLGLAIVRSIVEAHNGRVDVESIPGQGTTFRITLPVPLSDVR